MINSYQTRPPKAFSKRGKPPPCERSRVEILPAVRSSGCHSWNTSVALRSVPKDAPVRDRTGAATLLPLLQN